MSDQELRNENSNLPGNYTHWILASQTCNLYNANFEKIHSVEWIGAVECTASATHRAFEYGQNPRQLSCLATAADGTSVHLLADIQCRFWAPRKQLSKLQPLPKALRDSGTAKKEQQKDAFIGWLARSYTRLELSDELNGAMKSGRICEVLDDKLRKHADDIFGIFLTLSPMVDDPKQEAELLQSPVAIRPPCGLEITLVVFSPERVNDIEKALKSQFTEKIIPDSSASVKDHEPKKKINRLETARRCNITIAEAGLRVVTSTNWTVDDLSKNIRYSFVDYLSESNLPA